MYKFIQPTARVLVSGALALALAAGGSSAFGSESAQAALNQALEAFGARQQTADPFPDIEPGLAVEVQDLVMMNLAPDYGGVVGFWWSIAWSRGLVGAARLGAARKHCVFFLFCREGHDSGPRDSV